MGLLATPPNASPWMKRYSYFLKFEGSVFLGIFFVAYLLKLGVAWHDAGAPFDVTGIKFSAYWNMILIIYTTLGFYIFSASFDPAGFKPLLSWAMWGGNFGHGCVAFIHCFTDDVTPSSRYQFNTIGGTMNLDKLLVAVPLWFGMWAANLLFTKKVFGSFLLPWDRASLSAGAPPPAKQADVAYPEEAVMSV
mmetsp:Transcript_46834/g.142181  ORF Transcript_46834/g.142181 Transcript_46834/m.142181 type:complete len:192 (-) Transcript_46834:156-731(-)